MENGMKLHSQKVDNHKSSQKNSRVFSDRIQKRCKELGIKYSEFRKRIFALNPDVSEGTVHSWYYKNVHPSIDADWFTICEAIDCDIDYLFGRIEEPTHDTKYVHKRTGLSVHAIDVLSNSSGLFFEEPSKPSDNTTHYNPLSVVINYLLSDDNGENLLYHIENYVNQGGLSVTCKEERITDVIFVENKNTGSKYSFSQSDLDAIILTQIQTDLVKLKNKSKK